MHKYLQISTLLLAALLVGLCGHVPAQAQNQSTPTELRSPRARAADRYELPPKVLADMPWLQPSRMRRPELQRALEQSAQANALPQARPPAQSAAANSRAAQLAAACLNEDWVARYAEPGGSFDVAKDVAVDGSGNVYVTGFVSASAATDYLTIKYDATGAPKWTAHYNGPASDYDAAARIAVDGSGNVYVTGSSYNASGNSDFATVKYDANGVQQWAARYNGPANNADGAIALAVDGSGNVYVAGNSYNASGNPDYLTLKYNSAGVQQWEARYDGTGNDFDLLMALAVDGSGNVYVTGRSLNVDGNYDYATIKYNAAGVQQWLAPYNGPDELEDYGAALAVDGSGNVYVTGTSENTGGGWNYATLKYNAGGAQQWEARYNGPASGSKEARALALDATGNVYVTGDAFTGANFDYATVKYNNAGTQLWAKLYNGPANSTDAAYDLAVDGSDIYVTGYSYDAGGYSDYATVKYNAGGVEQCAARYNGPANSDDDANALAIDAGGNVYVTGRSYGLDVDYATVKYSTAPGPPTTIFAGLENLPLGNAGLDIDLNNHLVISNIGSSGLDGVSIDFTQAQFGVVDFAALNLSPGAFVQATAIGSLNNTPGQTLASITATGSSSGGSTIFGFDLSAVGVVAPCFIVYNGPTQVFFGVVPGNSLEVAGATAPDVYPFVPQGASGALAEVRLGQKFPITIPGGPTVTGDRIVALAEVLDVSPDWLSEIAVTAAGISTLTLESASLGMFNFPHEALGAALLDAVSPAPAGLTVSDVGPDALPGVHIDLDEAGSVNPCFLVGLAAVPLSGVNEQVHFEAESQQGPDALPIGAVDLLATGSGFSANVDFSPIGASLINVIVVNSGVPVGSAIVPAGNVGTITSASGPINLVRTFIDAAGDVGPDMLVGFQSPVGFEFPPTANSSPNPLLLGREGGFAASTFSGEEEGFSPSLLKRGGQGVSSDAGDTPSSVSFWKNLPSYSEELQLQEGGANTREGPYRMTVMGGAGATVETSRRLVSTNASSVIGDEIRFEAVNPTTTVSGISSVILQMANVPEFTIINEATEAPPVRVFVSNGPITIDRSKHSASRGDLHSNATIYFKKGDPTTFTGNLTAVGKITIDKDNTIAGNATSASTISVASGATITGTRTPNASVASLPISVASFSAGGQNITVPKSGTRTLNPGSYGNVILNKSATLNLKSGEYRFVKLETGATSNLNFNVSNGDVQVKITTSLKFGKEVTISITPGGEINSAAVEFITLQSAPVSIDKEGYVLGTITAPNAEISAGKNTSLHGAVSAKSITVDRDVIFWPHGVAGTLPVPKVSEDGESRIEDQVSSYQLEQNYPNPFNPSTVISFQLPVDSDVSLKIYDLQGRVVKSLVAGNLAAGKHEVTWDGRNESGARVASGVYVYRLKAGDPSAGSGQGFVARKKLVLMK